MPKRKVIEIFHDASFDKERAQQLFTAGVITLRDRAIAETIYFATVNRVAQIVDESPNGYDDIMNDLRSTQVDRYFCNFSLFQSLPDSWAIDQLFPILPIHRLDEEPTDRAVLADITCDSDGKIDHFIDRRDVKDVLELHPLTPDAPYYLGAFLVGAYQEILGDLHNLFGDTNTVHVALDPEEDYKIEGVVSGDTVSDVLRYVRYSRNDLVAKVRQAAETALRAKRMTLEESRQLLRRYEEGLSGYTYLEQD
jgi:arginine decarboxylase